MKWKLILLVVFFVIQSGCQQDDTAINWTPEIPALSKTRLQGVVLCPYRQGISGVKITVQDETYYTDENGFFDIPQVWIVKGRFNLIAEKEGYLTKSYAGKTQGEYTLIKFFLSEPKTLSFSSTESTTVMMENTEVKLPADGYIKANGSPYNGQVQVNYKEFHPSNEHFSTLMPGGDFVGTDSTGTEYFLYSYGAFTLDLYDTEGNELNLAEGKTASIRMKIAPDMLAEAPGEMPLWYLDKTTAKSNLGMETFIIIIYLN